MTIININNIANTEIAFYGIKNATVVFNFNKQNNVTFFFFFEEIPFLYHFIFTTNKYIVYIFYKNISRINSSYSAAWRLLKLFSFSKFKNQRFFFTNWFVHERIQKYSTTIRRRAYFIIQGSITMASHFFNEIQSCCESVKIEFWVCIFEPKNYIVKKT